MEPYQRYSLINKINQDACLNFTAYMPGKKINRTFLILILGMMSAIGPFSIDMYLAGFPAIAADLHTSVAHIALSLSSFFIGISVGQFIYGPLLDRYGRKKPLYIGLVLYIAASIGCAMAATADMLIALRLVQALGGCVGMVASRAIIRDVFPVNEIAKVFSKLMLVIAVSPIIAPTLGGYLVSAYGWHEVFIVLAIMAFVVLVCVHFVLPESMKADASSSLRPSLIMKNYFMVLRTPQFYTYAFTGAIAAAGLYAYISGSPYVFIEMFKVTEQQYGWIFAGVALGLITTSQVNSMLLKRFTSQQIIRVAIFCQMITGMILFIGSANGLLDVYSTIALIFLFLSCQGFIFPNTSALSMAPFQKNAGSASAMMGGIQMSIGALSSIIVSALSNGTAMPMTGMMALCSFTSMCFLFIGNRIITYKASADEVKEETLETISRI
jgi:DHA1 family bicyclomycin/chloramphenicol resistance-like MFS transporter